MDNFKMKPTITYGITDMRRCDVCKGGNIDISKNCVFHLGPFHGGWKFCGKDICKEIILGWYEEYYGKSFEIENEGTKILYHLPCAEVDSVKMGNSVANNYKKEFCIHAK